MFVTTHMPHLEGYMTFYFDSLQRIHDEDYKRFLEEESEKADAADLRDTTDLH